MAARKKPTGSTQAERDRIALGRIESYMDGLIKGHLICPSCRKDMEIKELPVSAVQLLRARYDKLRPSLQAIEQTNHDARDTADPSQLTAKLAALFTEKPQLLEQIQALMATAAQQSAPQSVEQHVTH